MIFDIAKGVDHNVPFTKLVLMDSYLYLHLAALLIVVLHKVGGAICVPKKRNVIALTEKK